MPAERVSMRRVREILRLKYEAGASDRAIARAVGVARSTARLCLDRVAAAGLTWPLPEGLTDGALEALLFAGAGAMAGQRRKAEPGWVEVHRELRRPGVTLMLLWEEYRAANPGGYQYSRWCELYRGWEARLSPTMRQVHPAGERLAHLRPAPERTEHDDPGQREQGHERAGVGAHQPSTVWTRACRTSRCWRAARRARCRPSSR